jgi:PAS domain S-box-containing protein
MTRSRLDPDRLDTAPDEPGRPGPDHPGRPDPDHPARPDPDQPNPGRLDPDLLPDGLMILDAERRIVEVNRACEKLTGFTRRELVGQDCPGALDLRDPDGEKLFAGGWHPSAKLPGTRAIPEHVVVVCRADGSEAFLSATGIYHRDPGGRIDGLTVSLRPATRRQDAAAGIEIVSTVSHELRSPLTSVKGYTSLMLNRWDRLPDDQKQLMLEQVNHDADRVTRLITELLDISRLESGRLVLRRHMVDLRRLAAEVVAKVSMEYPELEAETDFPPEFPKVYADPDKIEQVVTNLVENACKYASPKQLRIRGEVGDAFVSVAVTDHGEGIPETDVLKVFSKFFHRSVGRPTGSGLGLWISRGLVESHGGELSAQSILGEGSTFRFTLPLLDLDKPHAQ